PPSKRLQKLQNQRMIKLVLITSTVLVRIEGNAADEEFYFS
ncbi:8190_t:CDS:1, partial [Acaulospora morrowiae]